MSCSSAIWKQASASANSLRGLVRSVAATGLPFALYPFNIGVETRLIGRFMEDRYDLKRRHKVNVIEMAADQVPTMFHTLGRWKLGHSYNILRTYWELAQAPAEWAAMLQGIHEIWAPNEFVATAFAGYSMGLWTIVPPCVDIATTQDVRQSAPFGMDENSFYFLFSFDYFSHACPEKSTRRRACVPDRLSQSGAKGSDWSSNPRTRPTSILRSSSAILQATRHRPAHQGDRPHNCPATRCCR